MQRAVDKFVQNIAQLISSGKAAVWTVQPQAARRPQARFLGHAGAEEEHVSSGQQRVSGGAQSLFKCFFRLHLTIFTISHLQARRLLTDKDFLRACDSVSAGHVSRSF